MPKDQPISRPFSPWEVIHSSPSSKDIPTQQKRIVSASIPRKWHKSLNPFTGLVALCLAVSTLVFLYILPSNTQLHIDLNQFVNKTAACPNWVLPPSHHVLPRDLLLQHAKCTQIQDTNDHFNVSVCSSDAICTGGYLLIERLDKQKCAYMESQEVPVTEAELADYIHSSKGPDSFHIVFSGAEKSSTDPIEYLGDCTYRAFFKVKNGGDRSLEITHLYENYDGMNAIDARWPTLINTPLLNRNLSLNICPHCASRRALPRKPLDNADFPLTTKPLPMCSRSHKVEGVWLPAHQADQNSRERGNYTWVPLGCQMPVKLDEKAGDHYDCLDNNRGVIFYGDSQTRGTVDTLGKRLRKVATWKPPSDKHSNRQFWFRNFSMYFKWDPFLDLLLADTCQDLLDVDIIFIGIAQWPAAGVVQGGHWSTTQFYEYLDKIIHHTTRTLQKCRSRKNRLKVVWNGINAFPPSFNYITQARGDWRTLPRLEMWNEWAEERMSKAGISTINAWDITNPMIDATWDSAHFYGRDAIWALIDETVHKMDICDYNYD